MDFFETTHDSTRRANIMSVNPIFVPNIQKRILLKKKYVVSFGCYENSTTFATLLEKARRHMM